MVGIPIIFVGIFVAFVVLAVTSTIAASKREKQRLAALVHWASSQGFSVEPRKNSRIEKRFSEFGCFKQGNNRYAQNMIYGQYEGRAVYAFDYHYETTSTRTDSKGNRKTTTNHHHFSAVIIEPNLTLKPMLIRPEGFGDRIANFFGKGDIDFESAEFSKRFHVSASDRRWAYDVLHARTIERLLDTPAHTIEFAPHRVLLMHAGRRMGPQHMQTALHLIDGILDDMPDYLKEQMREATR